MLIKPWFETTVLAPGITRFTEPHVHGFFRANLYRIEGRDFDIQLDFGVGVRSLTEVSPAMGHPVLAIASHAHVDHVGSFHEYERRAGHRIEAHTFAEMDDAGTLASAFVEIEPPVTALPALDWTIANYALTPAPLTEFLDEGDAVDLGNRKFTVLHLPGHSPGSIALLDERNGDFFSADAIYDEGLVDDIPGADVETYLRTMRRLASLDVGTVYAGHGVVMDCAQMQRVARDYIASKGG
ncbi:MBL fold metallo-hydrolase [Rhizobium sp. TH2]|uniref:MBL fold metallo-hydrolase n=1 Tax=Rhizobium sp. TH2 TaxID=2775403 RepID=UPI0021582D54|nr:MBL fold metallo-hydrolase [Rhizobium sp. TH2]UVC07205.1 MBL fold metallo-hydrolase [Rhizobium sp. TH2]